MLRKDWIERKPLLLLSPTLFVECRAKIKIKNLKHSNNGKTRSCCAEFCIIACCFPLIAQHISTIGTNSIEIMFLRMVSYINSSISKKYLSTCHFQTASKSFFHANYSERPAKCIRACHSKIPEMSPGNGGIPP